MTFKILVVDDSDSARDLVRKALQSSGLDLEVVEAEDGAVALQKVLEGGIDIVLSDIVMPKLDGVELLRAIRKHHDADALPLILITSRTGDEVRTQSFEAGVNDYLCKPFSAIELVSRVQVQLRMRALQDELKQANERFRKLGARDELTGLANRRHFFELVHRELSRARRHLLPMSICVIDLDGFREVNNRVGYLIGDAIISETAVVLGRAARGDDVLARIGGEKLAALLPQTDAAEAQNLGEQLCEAVRTHVLPHPNAARVTISIGVATFPSHGVESVDELFNAAEASLDRAKERGGDRVELFEAVGGT